MVLAGILDLVQASNNSISDTCTQSAAAISRILGYAHKIENVVLQYDTPISSECFSTESFRVKDKEWHTYIPTAFWNEHYYRV